MSIGLCDENGNGRMAMIAVWRRNDGAKGIGLHRLGLAGFVAFGALAIGSLTAAAAHADSCPNEALRTELGSSFLPDCRAYEMVSPPYKEGYQLFPFRFSADGEKAIVGGLADLAGTPGAGESPLEGDLYVDARTASGWQLSPLNAPLSQFMGQIPLAYEADSGVTLWAQHTPAQSSTTRNLYVRSAAGAYSLVGPLTVPFVGEEEEEEEDNYILTFETHYDRPIAATSDFGHVVLRAKAPESYWSFDGTTGHEGSLYEYSGVGNTQPILVGVQGGKGSREVISTCGTLLGSGSEGSLYNGLSGDGESVFFTAVACEGRPAELYARLHGSLVSPAAAETVDVSGSECAGCGEASGKNFEGASEDGKIVFFTSTQKLTSGAVDGTASGDAAAGRGCAGTPEGFGGCDLYAYDFDAPGAECQVSHRCLRLVAGGEVLGVAGVAEDGQRVYYVKRASTGEPGGVPDLYVYDMATGQSTLVAALSYTGGEEEEAIWQRLFRHPVEVSGEDGRDLLFVSFTPGLTADDTASTPQLFEYDAVTGELVRVSKGEDGYNENGNAARAGVGPESIEGIAEALGKSSDFKSGVNRLNVSFDGRTVVFKSNGRLSRFATSAERGCSSVYEFRTPGALAEGSVHLLSDGVDAQPRAGGVCGAGFFAIDGSGDNALFSTADPLLTSDVDGVQRDIYDARVGGGFAVAQGGVCAAGCGSPAGSVAPGSPVVGSVTQAPEAPASAPAAPKPKAKAKVKVTKCAKDKKLDHGKCVGVKSRKITRKAKRATRERRGK